MKKRINEYLENCKNLKESNLQLALKEEKKIQESYNQREAFKDRYYIIKDMKRREEQTRSRLMEAARNDALATALKAIYITALEAETLTDDGIILAESMVDNWIAENGGASKILREAPKTYLISRLAQIVEDAAENSVKEIEADESEIPDSDDKKEKKESDKKDDDKGSKTKAEIKDDALDSAKDFIKDASKKDVKDFLSKVVDSIQKSSENKGQEKAEKKLEKETDPDNKTDDNVGASVADDNDKTEPTTPEDGTSDNSTISDEPAEPETSDSTVDNNDSDADTADQDSSVDNVPADDSEVKATDTENGTPDTDPEVSDDNNSDDALNDMNDDVPDDSTEDNNSDTASENEPTSQEAEVSDSGQSNDNTDEDKTESTTSEDETSDNSTASEPENNTDNSDSNTPQDNGDLDLPSTEVDPNEDPNEDDDIKDELGEPLDDDGIDTDTTIDGDTENNGEIFDDLEKEEDVQKAIDLIKTRVADAEENFIRNNAEDKKKMDEIITKISNNVKTVEDINNSNNTESKIATESARINKRKLDAIRDKRPLTIFEKMCRNLSTNIIRDKAVLESYSDESGKLDTSLVVESAKVMYGFLETVNTLQLQKVDEKYIKNVLDNM